MAIVPLCELMRRTVSRALGESAKASPDFLAPAELMNWLTKGYHEIVRQTHLYTKTLTQDLAAGAFQSPPADIMDRMVWHEHALRVLSGSNYTPLRERTYEYLEATYPLLDATPAGAPCEWGWDESSGQLRMILLPPPPALVAIGLKLDYIADPPALTRNYDPDAVTCGVTNASASVTFGASVVGLIAADDAFGVKTSSLTLPAKYYRVQSVANDGLSLTLTAAYAEQTNAAALFTGSQVSALEYSRPGLVEYAPVEWALAEYFQREEGEAAAAPQRTRFDAEVLRILKQMGQRPGLQYKRRNALIYPGIRSRMCS